MSTRTRTLIAAAAGAGAAAGLAGLAARPAVRRAARQTARFARPVRHGPARPPVPPALPPGRVIDLPGRGEGFARDSGGSPADATVLLLHGWTASADINFFGVYAGLAQAYRVIAPDLRGHGRGIRSAERFTLKDCADDAAVLLDQLAVEHVIAVGYSMGGAVGLLLARRHPGRVTALVMQATALDWRHTARERIAWRLLSAFEPGLRLGAGAGVIERVLRRAAGEQPGLDAWRPWLAAEFGRGQPRALADAGRALSRCDARPWAAGLGLPAAVLVTTRDRLVRPARQRELAGALGAQVIEIDADHDLPLARGAEYARLTRLAVDEVAARARLGAGRPAALPRPAAARSGGTTDFPPAGAGPTALPFRPCGGDAVSMGSHGQSDDMKTVVRDVMSARPVWVGETAPVREIAAKLRESRVSAFPVLYPVPPVPSRPGLYF